MFAFKKTLERFLFEVTDRYTDDAVLYLVGECSLVIEGHRSFCSEVIVTSDVSVEKQASFRAAVDAAAALVGLAVAIEDPGDVIPLPEQARVRSRAVTGFDAHATGLRIRHFDPYTTAIRFIARGDQPDYDLVVALQEMGWINMAALEEEIQLLLPRFSFDTIQQDPAEFRRKFKGLTQIVNAR